MVEPLIYRVTNVVGDEEDSYCRSTPEIFLVLTGLEDPECEFLVVRMVEDSQGGRFNSADCKVEFEFRKDSYSCWMSFCGNGEACIRNINVLPVENMRVA